MLRGQRAALTKAINRFEAAVDDYAFLGTIPVDTADALNARAAIEREYVRSRKLLVDFVERIAG